MIQRNFRLISIAVLLISTVSCLAAEPLPSSIVTGNVQTFAISCPGNPQQTTIDMNNCISTKLDAVKSVEKKYVSVARSRISAEKNNQALGAFEKENQAWDRLIEASSQATYAYWREGTLRGLKATDREIALIELRIHDQWQNWLGYEDSTPPLLPEPRFNNVG